MNSTVSVIIPTFNREHLLPFALESVFAQTLPAAEVIVVDDGSTDNTRELVSRHAGRVRYIFRQNGGIGAARNTGMEHARGAVLAFLDSDDLWVANKLEKQMEALASHPKDPFIFSHYRETNAAGLPQGGARQGFTASGCLVPAEISRRVGNFDVDFGVGEFIDWIARAQFKGFGTCLLPETLFYRRVHNSNTVLLRRSAFGDYAKILKAKLDRERSNSAKAILQTDARDSSRTESS